MFTGIITAIGQLTKIEKIAGDARLFFNAGKLDLADVKLGDSIAVNGVCLTVVVLHHAEFAMDLSVETLARTSLGRLTIGARVNLEKAMLPTTRFGGHIVSGHVDGLGEVMSRTKMARAVEFVIKVPTELNRYIVEKGSITIDGVSLTVNAIEENLLKIMIIPHTLEQTIIADYQPGSCVNIEIDILARYLEKLLK